ncbi:MAG: HAMP domain-containing sensor histidine kinase [Bacteroidota bacterium]
MAPARLPARSAATFKLVLLAAAFALVVGILLYSQRIVDRLLEEQRQVVDLYVRSLEYLASDRPAGGDISFIFDEIIRSIDFPLVLTDPGNNPLRPFRAYVRNIDLDTTLTDAGQEAVLRDIISRLDERNTPIRVSLGDSVVLNYAHYGESDLVRQLRWVPWVEISLAGLFILIGYLGFSYIKQSEQSSIWVGMARETAHQLGTPLSSMMGWMELVKTHAAGNEQVLQTAAEMEQDLDRLNKVAARFSKIGSVPDLREEDLAQVIRGVMRYMERRLPRSGRTVELVMETPGIFPARINRELFEWVIENIMKNALDAMEGPSGRIGFALGRSKGHTVIDISDTGRGIDPKLHREIFRPGFSTKKRGWGLGLSLSRRIIQEYHRGRLAVHRSGPGAGTTFRIRLPH